MDGPGVADAVPGIDPESYEAPVLFTLTVAGELVAVGRAVDGGTSYDWASGPNEGYGYGSSASPDRPHSWGGSRATANTSTSRCWAR